MTTSFGSVESAEELLKIVSLLPLEKDVSVEDMISPKKQVKSSSLSSVSEKDKEVVHSGSIEVTSSLISKETKTMNVEFLEENKVGEELQQIKEISEISTEDDQCGDDLLKKEEDVVETVSISESLIFEKNRKDSDLQTLLETEKRRSLARDYEFRKIGNGSKVKPEKMEKIRVKDNGFVRRSVKIELVDDTALLDVVSFYKKVKDHSKRSFDKEASRKHKKIGKENSSEVVERNVSTKVSEFRNSEETNEKKFRVMYSRNQMESMRYDHIAKQKKLWSDMYASLLPELVTEYEGLVGFKYQKPSKSYPTESGISILGPVSTVPRRNRVNIFVH